MRRMIVFLLAAAVMAPGCKRTDPPSPTDTSPLPTQFLFNANLLPASEVPPVTGAEASGSGFASIKLIVTRDGNGAISSATADFFCTMTGFPQTLNVTAAHIHPGPAGVNGGVIVNTGVSSGSVPLSGGAGNFTRNGIAVSAANAQGILDNPAGYYFNVHSTANGGGFMRGQLVRIQ